MEPSYVGIDVGKAHLEVCVRDGGRERSLRVSNTAGGCRGLLKQLSKYNPAMIAMEATGGYERRAWVQLATSGLPVA